MYSIETAVISVQTTIKAPLTTVWKHWTTPEDIMKWNNASDDWHTTHAENDLWPGGKFLFRMEAKDGSVGFDFSGIYNQVVTNQQINYTMDDGRKAEIIFTDNGNETKVVETFEPEIINQIELQRSGWQAILDNFKKYVEENNNK